jgi:tight adherence protein B
MFFAIIVGILVAIAIAIFLLGVGRSIEPEEELDQRIEEWVVSRSRTGATGLEVDDGVDGVLGQMERSISQQSFAARMRTDLARADLKITVAEYLLIRTVIVVAGFAIGFFIARNLLSGLLVAGVGFVIPILYVGMRQRRRLRAFEDQLPDVLDHMVGSLRAGYGLMQAVEWVGRQLSDPAGEEFRRVLREVQLGRSLMDAFDSMVRRIDSDDLALIVTAIKIQHEVGGSLAEILEIVAHTIRERVRILREIEVLTSQQRYSGYVLMVMPIALGLVLFLMSPDYMMQLFQPGPTLCIPIGAVILMVIGFFAMRRIVDIEV